ncbi:MAG: DUF58 domain-containing protein [Anaerolineae bacterium]|nr:DUF58 domain-containing protein [Anaerolineae bacterium]
MHNLQRSWVLFLLWFASLIATLSIGGPLFFSLTYLFTAILLFSFIWAWLNVHWIRVTRQIRARQVQVGGFIEEHFVMQNTGWLPKLWIQFKDESNLPGHRANRVISSLGGKSQKTWHVRTPCYQRGRFSLGPISLTSGDPFGLFEFTQRLSHFASHVVVYPMTVDLPTFQPPVGEQTGGEAVRRRTHYVTTNVSGIRDYVFGDSFNRIHWPSTARNNRMMVKEFELDPMADVWIFLDMERRVQAGLSYKDIPPPDLPLVHWEKLPEFKLPPSTEEYSVAVAASVAKHFLERNRSVGLITYANAHHREIAQSDRGERQLARIYEMLAVAQAHGTIPLAEVLAAETLRFSRNITLVIVTPAVELQWVSVAHHIMSRGVRVTAIVIDPGSFGMPHHSLEVEIELTASHIPHYVVRQGDALGQVLTTTRVTR